MISIKVSRLSLDRAWTGHGHPTPPHIAEADASGEGLRPRGEEPRQRPRTITHALKIANVVEIDELRVHTHGKNKPLVVKGGHGRSGILHREMQESLIVWDGGVKVQHSSAQQVTRCWALGGRRTTWQLGERRSHRRSVPSMDVDINVSLAGDMFSEVTL